MEENTQFPYLLSMRAQTQRGVKLVLLGQQNFVIWIDGMLAP